MKFFYENVYEPEEDTYLLLDLVKNKKGKILDMGSGSGILGLTNAFFNPENIVYCVDVDENAIKTINKNKKINKIKNAMAIKSDLFSNMNEKFDYIFFNPPYLPGNKYKDLDGGKYGDEIILKFLRDVKKYLNNNGTVYLLFSSHTRQDRIYALLKKLNFNYKIIKEKNLFFEKLFVLEIKL